MIDTKYLIKNLNLIQALNTRLTNLNLEQNNKIVYNFIVQLLQIEYNKKYLKQDYYLILYVYKNKE